MAWTRMLAIVMVSAGLGYLPAACDRPSSSMMDGGMMGGGMMGRMPGGDSAQTLPEPQSEQAQLFREYCGECHVPPSPKAHTADEWPQVVARMKQHMATQGKIAPDSGRLQDIVDYLQRHAE